MKKLIVLVIFLIFAAGIVALTEEKAAETTPDKKVEESKDVKAEPAKEEAAAQSQEAPIEQPKEAVKEAPAEEKKDEAATKEEKKDKKKKKKGEITIPDAPVSVLIPEGEFSMGNDPHKWRDNEAPKHTVYVDAFYMDTFEVRNEEYKKCVDAGACKAAKWADSTSYNHDKYPVVGVSWNDAKVYCEWAKKRLPTEAQWEKAAKGGADTKYAWGNSFSRYSKEKYANIMGDHDKHDRTSPVGAFPKGKNPYGLYDMNGNVAEWVADYYSNDYYSKSEPKNPKGPAEGTDRVVRGGSWQDAPPTISNTYREHENPDKLEKYIGFRCAADK